MAFSALGEMCHDGWLALDAVKERDLLVLTAHSAICKFSCKHFKWAFHILLA